MAKHIPKVALDPIGVDGEGAPLAGQGRVSRLIGRRTMAQYRTLTLSKAYAILKSAGFSPDAYRWLPSGRLFAFAFRVGRELEVYGVHSPPLKSRPIVQDTT